MSRYIDANANRETMLKCAENPESMNAELCYRFVARILEEAPTIDAVQVVRCGRCDYYSNEMNCCSYVNGLQNVTKTDYCSYGRCADGERRTDEQPS